MYPYFFCLLLLLLLPSPAALAAETAATTAAADSAAAPAKGQVEWVWEPDPYYTALSVEFPLTDAPVPDGGRMAERDIYRKLFLESFRPRRLLFEASVNPLPSLGAWYKKHQRDSYEDFSLGEAGSTSLNLIDGLTAGFEEPWAFSIFTGSIMQFTRPGEKGGSRNRAYMGYLVSGGAKHIRNNVLIDDSWWEFEWMLKGTRQFRDDELSWSFRLGVKNHGNADISDVAYLGLRRSNLNYGSPWLAVLDNSDIELMTEIDRQSGRFLHQEVIVGRKLPLQRWHVALTLGVGVIYEDPHKYTGRLADPSADRLTFVFRPNLQF